MSLPSSPAWPPIICRKCAYENVPSAKLCNLCQEPLALPGAPPPLTAQQRLEIEMQKALMERKSSGLQRATYRWLALMLGGFSLMLILFGIRVFRTVPQGQLPGMAMIAFAFGLFLIFMLYVYRKTKS